MKAMQLWMAIPPALAPAPALAVTAAAAPTDGLDVQTLSTTTVEGIEYAVTRITVAPGEAAGRPIRQVGAAVSVGAPTPTGCPVF